MGTAEIYAAALSVDAVTDALVVDVDDWMPLFVVTDGEPDVGAIRAAIREHCSPRHVPNEIIRVDAVPRTLSGKVLEVPVKKLFQGADPEHGRLPRVARQPRGVRLVRRVRRATEADTASTDVAGGRRGRYGDHDTSARRLRRWARNEVITAAPAHARWASPVARSPRPGAA